MTREGPAWARRRLGTRLWELRAQARLDEAAAAAAFHATPTALTRIEAGMMTVGEPDVTALLRAYRATDAGLRQVLLAMASESHRATAWDEAAGSLPDPLWLYLALETEADMIKIYAPGRIPALLAGDGQAVAEDPLTAGGDGITAALSARVARRRQALLVQPGPPRVWAVIHEEALHQATGGQLAALAAASRQTRIAIQIVPKSAPAAARAGGPFAILQAGSTVVTSYAYDDHHPATAPAGAQMALDQCNSWFNRLAVQAAWPGRTYSMLSDLLRQS
jgi:transcriptional regulator with XRE-family HTH domain